MIVGLGPWHGGIPALGWGNNCLSGTECTGVIGIGEVDEERLGTAAYTGQEVSYHGTIAFTWFSETYRTGAAV